MNSRLIQKGALVEDNGQLCNVHDIRLQTDQVVLEGAVGNLVFYGISEFNNRVDTQDILVDVPDPANTPTCEERPIPVRVITP